MRTDARRVALRELMDFDWIGHVIDFIFPDDEPPYESETAADAASEGGKGDQAGITADGTAAPASAGVGAAGDEEHKGVEAPQAGRDSAAGNDPAQAASPTDVSQSGRSRAGSDERSRPRRAVIPPGVIGEDSRDDAFYAMVEGATVQSPHAATDQGHDADDAEAGDDGAGAGGVDEGMSAASVSGDDGTGSDAGSADGASVAPKPFTLTRLFLNFFRSAAYYTPSDRCSTRAQGVLSLGTLRVGSNILSSSKNQGFKISARDAALHIVDEGAWRLTCGRECVLARCSTKRKFPVVVATVSCSSHSRA